MMCTLTQRELDFLASLKTGWRRLYRRELVRLLQGDAEAERSSAGDAPDRLARRIGLIFRESSRFSDATVVELSQLTRNGRGLRPAFVQTRFCPHCPPKLGAVRRGVSCLALHVSKVPGFPSQPRAGCCSPSSAPLRSPRAHNRRSAARGPISPPQAGRPRSSGPTG